mgnify:FL=1
MQNRNCMQRSVEAALFVISLLMFSFGCDEQSKISSEPVSASNTASSSALVTGPVSNPVFVTYVVCSAEFPDGQRYSHMLRITAALDAVEFTGGLGQRVFVAQTSSIDLSAGQLLASFAAKKFELSIDRTSLDYGLTYNVEQADDKVFVEGRCNVLEGEDFKL